MMRFTKLIKTTALINLIILVVCDDIWPKSDLIFVTALILLIAHMIVIFPMTYFIEKKSREMNECYTCGIENIDHGEYNKAIDNFNKIIESDLEITDAKTYINAYICRGNVYNARGEYEKAISDFNKVIELDPKNETAYSNRANSYFKNGQYAEALIDLNKSIDLEPENSMNYVNRGVFYERYADRERALCDYQTALKLDSQNNTAKACLKRFKNKM